MNKTGLYRIASLFDAARDTFEALGGLREVLDEHTALTKEVESLRERQAPEALLKRCRELSEENSKLKKQNSDLQAETNRYRSRYERLAGNEEK